MVLQVFLSQENFFSLNFLLMVKIAETIGEGIRIIFFKTLMQNPCQTPKINFTPTQFIAS